MNYSHNKSYITTNITSQAGLLANERVWPRSDFSN